MPWILKNRWLGRLDSLISSLIYIFFSFLEPHLWPTNTAEDREDADTNHFEACLHPALDTAASHCSYPLIKPSAGLLY